MVLTRRLVRRKLPSGGEVWLSAVTGAADKLSREEVDMVERALAGDFTLTEGLQGQLEARGYLYPDPQAEEAAFSRLVKEQSDLATGNDSVKHLIVCPTYSCNLRCIYCFEQCSRPRRSHSSMDATAVTQVMAAFDRIRSQAPKHRYSIGLFGGEPLMFANRLVVSHILAHARDESLPVMIVTNGVNVSSYLPLLMEYRPVIGAVQLTMDGPEEVHDRRRPTASGRGTFIAVAAAADVLLEAGIRVLLRVNIDRGNVSYLPQVTEIADLHGWTGSRLFSASLSPVRDHLAQGDIPNVTPEAELLSSLIDIYDEHPATEKLFGFKGFQVLSPIASLGQPRDPDEPVPGPRIFNCEANLGGFYVAGPDGYLYACPEAIGQPELAIGRYAPELEVWDSEVGKWTGRNLKTLDDCSGCEIGPLCGGGCTYASIARFGDARRPACDPALMEAVEVFLERRAAV